jgi:hypothetical protein
MFNRHILRGLPLGWDKNKCILTLIEAYVSTNKLVILNADASYTIINEGEGEWVEGIWFSNKHHTGDWTRGAGAAYKKSVTSYYTTQDYESQEWVQGIGYVPKDSTYALGKAERRAKARAKATKLLEDKKKEKMGNSGEEELCNWCSKPFDQSELVTVTHGKRGAIFTVCHDCLGKIQ